MGCILFDVCWCYVAVWLWWCGIRMQAEALHQIGLSLLNYQDDARSDKHKIHEYEKFVIHSLTDGTCCCCCYCVCV